MIRRKELIRGFVSVRLSDISKSSAPIPHSRFRPPKLMLLKCCMALQKQLTEAHREPECYPSTMEDGESDTKSSQKYRRGRGRPVSLLLLFVFLTTACALGLLSAMHLLDLELISDSTAKSSLLSRLSPMGTSSVRHTMPPQPTKPVERWSDRNFNNSYVRDHLDEYECVGWLAAPNDDLSEMTLTANETYLESCSKVIKANEAGFCVVQHKETKELASVMHMYHDSLRAAVQTRCSDFDSILQHGVKATEYVYDANFSIESTRLKLVEDHNKALMELESPFIRRTLADFSDDFFRRGISFVVYGKVLEGAYVAIRTLRAYGCELPIEIWYSPSEVSVSHPILQKLFNEQDVYFRELRDHSLSSFYTKNYAIYYSSFDSVLLFDADNYVVKDPTFLFDTPEFAKTGAMFWPDYWSPRKTIFNIHSRSFIWEFLDMESIDMFEQESGQVLVDRTRSTHALNTMMYYAVHAASKINSLRLAWGDKDLFRFAWMKTNTSFHMIQMPPGAVGEKHSSKDIFCGTTIAQHDPSNEIVFLHRNQQKLAEGNRRKVWTHVQQFKLMEVDVVEYEVRGARGGRFFPHLLKCFGKDSKYKSKFSVKPVDEYPFATLEDDLLMYLDEAVNASSEG